MYTEKSWVLILSLWFRLYSQSGKISTDDFMMCYVLLSQTYLKFPCENYTSFLRVCLLTIQFYHVYVLICGWMFSLTRGNILHNESAQRKVTLFFFLICNVYRLEFVKKNELKSSIWDPVFKKCTKQTLYVYTSFISKTLLSSLGVFYEDISIINISLFWITFDVSPEQIDDLWCWSGLKMVTKLLK